MPDTSSDQERRRLTELYSHMTEEELQEIAADSISLTPEAHQALTAEMERRSMPTISESQETASAIEFQDLVTIRQFRDLPQAILAKGVLDSAGISCFLADENIVRMDWFISNLVGGVKLKVGREDMEAANSVLEEPAAEEPEEFDQQKEDGC